MVDIWLILLGVMALYVVDMLMHLLALHQAIQLGIASGVEVY